METKLLDLNAYGVEEMSNVKMRNTNGGFTTQGMTIMSAEQYDAMAGTAAGHAGIIVGIIRGIFGF